MSEHTVAKSGQAPRSDAPSGRRSPPEAATESRLVRMKRSMGDRAFGYAIQTRLTVGPVGDRYEQEADSVAEQVMGPHAGANEPAGEHAREHAEPQVQRACQSCGASLSSTDDQTQVRRRCAACEHEDESVRRRAQPNAPPGPAETIDDRELASGGNPLPSSVRRFFESRFARDFGDVRVHSGPAAQHFTDHLHAYAFTYGSHIWMGRGQSVHPSFLMAHELVHVIQQTRPPRIASHGHAVPQGIHPDAHGPLIRRFEPYWEPFDFNGRRTHTMVLPPMGQASSAFTEAPVANAKTSAGNVGELAGIGRVGQVDFYKGSTTVGVFFNGHAKPVALTAGDVPSMIMNGGQRYEHNTLSAPQVVGGRMVNSARGPSTIKIGDLKPSHGTLEAYIGTFQLEGYKKGFEMAHREANDPATPGDGKQWNPLSVSMLGPNELTIPKQFVHPQYDGQDSRVLVIKQFGKKAMSPRTEVRGHLCVRPDTTAGIWNYTWVPDTKPTAAVLPARINRLHPTLKTKIIDPLLTSPLAKKPKLKPGPRPEVSESASRSPQRVIQRAPTAPEKDNFDLDAWKQSRKEVGDELKEGEKSSEFKDAEEKILENRAHEAIREKFGLPLPEITGGKEAGKTIGQLEFWTGLLAAPLGFFRKVFGVTFVKVAQFFIKIRDKVRDFLKKMKAKASVGGGFLSAALRAAFKGLKIVARFVIGRVVDRMMETLVTGVADKLKEIIGLDNLEALEAKVEEVKRLQDELEKKVTDTADQLVDTLFGVHLKDLEKLKDVYDIFQDIITLVNLVRWGARVVACLSPPALGCLWILAEAALDWAAQKVAETCWFQEKIRPLLMKVQYVTTELPNKIADGITNKLRDLLPEGVKGVLAERKGDPPDGTDAENCEEEDDQTAFVESPLHNEMEALFQKIGPERAEALKLLGSKLQLNDSQPLTSDLIRQFGEQLMKVSPEALQKYAETYPAAAQGVPLDVSKFVENLQKNGGVPPPSAAPATDAPQSGAADPPPGPGGPDDSTELKKEPPAAGGSADQSPQKPGEESKGDQSGGMAVVEASTRAFDDAAPSTPNPDVKARIANADWKHTLGDDVRIHLVIFWKNEAKVLIRNVETQVGHRDWAIKDVMMVTPYIAKHGYRITEIPNALIPKGMALKAPLFTAQGEEMLKKLQAEKAAAAPKTK